MNHICQDCNEKIPNGHAVIRSQSFKRVAYCSWCWARKSATRLVSVGAGRVAS